jgi:CBS domain-containing protein
MSKKVKDVMTDKCEWISPDTSCTEAAKIMRDGDFGFLPVGENDKLIGMVTDRDITIRCTAEGHDPKTTQIKNVMTKKTYYCYDDQSVEEVCDNLGDIQVRRLPVVNRDKRLVGVVSMGDLAQAAAKANVGETEQQITAETARKKAA